jgi:predicted transcriptional regulator
MEKRNLTITVQSDWRSALRAVADSAKAEVYQGEVLNFESPAAFFGQLSSRRWELVQLLISAGEIPVRELARRAGRDVKRVHEDISILTELGLLERSERGGVYCPYTDIHVDMHLREAV